jgi:formate hydrogenlyase subunit 6/NADH:ubiquinone oxidoreductase subunit I
MDPNFRIVRDSDRCIACYECVIVCPQSSEGKRRPVLAYPRETGKPPEVVNIQNCIQCMTCWDFCRAQAITFHNHHRVARLIENEAVLAKVAKII